MEIRNLPRNKATLILRSDASTAIGTGHVMRCLALAQAWQDAGGRAVFAIAEAARAIRERLLAENMEVVPLKVQAGGEDDAAKVAELALLQSAKWIVVDGYQFGVDYQHQLKGSGVKLLFVDDNGHARHYSADIVLNQNVHADESLYRNREPYTRLLLGPRYVLLRREFAQWREWKREIAPVGRKILISMGGSDPDNISASVIEELQPLASEAIEATVVVGAGNPHFESLKLAARSFSGTLSLKKDVSNMPDLMAWADIAIVGAGTTTWELCLMGLPAILIDLAENQRAIATELNRLGVAIHLKCNEAGFKHKLAGTVRDLLMSSSERSAMSQHAKKLVDGKGALRVVSAIQCGTLLLRPAEQIDCRQLFEWANDPEVRQTSFSSAPIPWDQHEAWFNDKQNDSACRILIAEDEDGKPVGQFRVDFTSDKEGEIDVSVSRIFRGAGYGSLLIDLGVRRLFSETTMDRLNAFVKPENVASRKAFEHAGFENLGDKNVNGHRAIHYVRSRSGGTSTDGI